MRQFRVEKASLTCKWSFAQLLPSLPSPGTPAFAGLARALQSYGFKASGVTVEAPTSRLSDVSLGLMLFDDRLALRFTYATVEMALTDYYNDDEQPLIAVAEAAFKSLGDVETTQTGVHVFINDRSHVSLDPGESESFIREHLSCDVASFIPDAFAYNLRTEKSRNIRIVVAKSVVFPSALYLDFSAEYIDPGSPPELARVAKYDFRETFAKLGLEPARSIFGADANLAIKEEKASSGVFRVTIFALLQQQQLSAPTTNCLEQVRWLRNHQHEFPGEWVALDGTHLVAHAKHAREVFEVARNVGVKIPFVVRVPAEDEELPFAGW